MATDSGGTSTSLFDILKAPASPSVHDDEFRTPGLPSANWSLWNPGGALLSATVSPQGLRLVGLDDPARAVSSMGLFRDIPDEDEFEIIAPIHMGLRAVPSATEGIAGIMVAGDIAGSPTTSPICGVAYLLDAAGPDGVQSYIQATFGANFGSASKQQDVGVLSGYLALQYKKTGNIFSAWYSDTGLAWSQIVASDVSGISTALYIGYTINVFGNVDTTLVSQFFRVTRVGASGIINDPPASLGGYVST